MGNVFSFFKKIKGTKEQLEDLENEIDQIEEYKISASIRERNCNALLIVSSVIIYVIGFVYLYLDYNTHKSYVYKTISLCFILFVPPIGYYAKSLARIYYKWVKETNDMKYIALLKLKKKILSKVQETETFNDAKVILERFDPGALRNMSMSLNNLSIIDRENTTNYRPRPSTSAIQNSPRTLSPPTRTTNQIVSSNNLVSFNPPVNISATPRQPLNRTVKPILPQNRSVVEKVVDYMFADGPSNRYALICVRCYSHNGMALADEFEYISYICAYCGTFNPARKLRPTAPKTDLTKAIEAPKIEEKDDNQNSTVKITEISSELNKTIEHRSEPVVEECEKSNEKDSVKDNDHHEKEELQYIDEEESAQDDTLSYETSNKKQD